MKKRLSDREEQILLLLKKFDFLSRDHLNKYFKLGTVRNANYVLKEIGPYLSKFKEGYQTVYYLSKLGKDHVDCEKVRKKGGHVIHTLMRNEMWLFHDCPKDWRNEIEVSDGHSKVVVDAMFTDGWDRKHFLEIDNTQTMSENRNKIKRYKEIFNNGLIEQKLGHFPTIVWLTTTEHRRKQLKEECAGLPVVMVFTTNDIQ